MDELGVGLFSNTPSSMEQNKSIWLQLFGFRKENYYKIGWPKGPEGRLLLWAYIFNVFNTFSIRIMVIKNGIYYLS